MELQDLYKLLHQGALGSEHAVPGYQQVVDWLTSEVARLAAEGPSAADLPGPLIESVAPGGEIVRVHLRPYLAAGWDTGPLLEAFVRTAAEFPRSEERLVLFAGIAEAMARAGQLSVDPDSLRQFFRSREREGFPAMHHSEAFEAEYRPAYRVVARSLLPDSIQGR